MLNQLPALSDVRQPRGVVRIKTDTMSWQILTGWVECEVEQNAYAAADTFRVVLSATMLPPETDANWFSNQAAITVEIFAGFPADPESFAIGELDSLIVGNVDDIDESMDGGTITLTGRDKTALLIDTKTAEAYLSKTASGVAKIFAAEHGLDVSNANGQTVVDTTTKIGNNYAQHSATLSTSKSEWDILMELAKNEGFACYVKGNELHFEPLPSEDADAYVLRWEPPNAERASPLFNGKSLSFRRKLTISRGVVVIVTASQLNAKLPIKAVYPRSAPSGAAAGTSGAGKAKVQVFEIEAKPGTSKADALKIAQAKYHEIIAHEMKMEAEIPGDAVLSTVNPLKVEGTGRAYDQIYFADSITRKLSARNGFTMRVSAKNRSPNNPV